MTTTTAPASRWVTEGTAAAVLARLGEVGAAWLAGIDDTIAELCARWSLIPVEPLGGGKYSAVVAATTADGSDVVVKVAPDPAATRSERFTYEAWQRASAGMCPQVVAHDPTTGALCVQRIRPGTELAESPAPDDVELEFLDRVLATTTSACPTAARRCSIEHLRGRLALIAERTERLGVEGGDAIVEVAAAALARIEADTGGGVALCHGDLHHGNVIDAGGAWAVIDPVGLAGPVEYDAAFFAVTRGGGHGIADRIDIYTETLGLDRERLAAHCAFFAADRLMIAHWYRIDDTVIDPLTAVVTDRHHLGG